MFLALVAAATLHGAGALVGPLPEGATSFTALAGRPFYSMRVDRGLLEGFDAGLGLDLSPAGFLRPVAQARLRAFQLGPVQGVFRATAAWVVPTQRTGYGPRALARTADGEAAFALDLAPMESLAVHGEVALLGQTDLTREHSASFAQLLAGLEWAAAGPLSLLGRAGVLRGSRASAAVGSAGIAWRF